MSAPASGYRINSGVLPHFKLPNCLPTTANQTAFAPFTIETWVKLLTFPQNAGLFCTLPRPGVDAYSASGLNLYLRVQSGAGFAFMISNKFITKGTVPVGAWFHLAWAYSGAVATGYLNGTEIGSGSVANAPVGQGPTIHPLYNEPPYGAADAEINRVRIWDRVLTQADVFSSMNEAALPAWTDGLLMECLFDEAARYLVPRIAPPSILYGNPIVPVALGTLAGTAVEASGDPVDTVLILGHDSHRTVSSVSAGVDGAWAAAVPAGQYDIAYLSDECGPICHGPYTVTAD